MKPRINELTVKYIECGNCRFEKSCLLPEVNLCERFNWNCPQCRQSWSGILLTDNDFEIEACSEQSKIEEYILVKKHKDFIPWILLAQKHSADQENTTESEPASTFYLFAAQHDAINNPHGLLQYEAFPAKQ